jgi:hypothetical protein
LKIPLDHPAFVGHNEDEHQPEKAMSDKKGYNGWTNYETWNLALWIDNEQGSYNYWRERARESLAGQNSETREARVSDAAVDLADELKGETEDNAPKLEGFYGDILGAAISEVNWYEIAKNWIEEIADDIESEREAANS